MDFLRSATSSSCRAAGSEAAVRRGDVDLVLVITAATART